MVGMGAYNRFKLDSRRQVERMAEIPRPAASNFVRGSAAHLNVTLSLESGDDACQSPRWDDTMSDVKVEIRC